MNTQNPYHHLPTEITSNKIALGTVQFGLNYGINNQQGQISPIEVGNILSFAHQMGLDTLDTAHAYGESETVLGQQSLAHFKIVSKSPAYGSSSIRMHLEESLSRLKLKGLYGYLFHDFRTFRKKPEGWVVFEQLKAEGLLEKIGFSLYQPEDLRWIWKQHIKPDLIQIPYNIFDRRFEEIFDESSARGIEIHSRSAFLQGLFFKEISLLPPHFQSVSTHIHQLHRLSKKYALPIAHICLYFCLSQVHIDRVVIGIDSLSQLKHNIELTQSIEFPAQLLADLRQLKVEDETIINPALWKL